MKYLAWVMIIAVSLSLTGCLAGTTAVTTIVEEGDKITTTLTGAAVQRDIVYADERKHRDTQTQKMYKESGITMKNKMYTLSDGTQAFLPESITVKAPHKYQQNIETRPPDHRGWETADKALGILGNGVLGYFLNDAFKTNSSAGQTKYYGDYNPQTAQPYIVEPFVVTP